MDNLRAAILRPQLRGLRARCAAWTERYRVVEEGLRGTPGLSLVERPAEEAFVGSSFQFLLLDWPAEAIAGVVARCGHRGVELKWFGEAEPRGFTSRYDSWRYAPSEPMPATDRVLAGLLDMRLPLTFSLEDCAQIARIIRAEVEAAAQGHQAAE
jgi:dTDP-4-amino-4,6-dideoxygalactose transaminase